MDSRLAGMTKKGWGKVIVLGEEMFEGDVAGVLINRFLHCGRNDNGGGGCGRNDNGVGRDVMRLRKQVQGLVFLDFLSF